MLTFMVLVVLSLLSKNLADQWSDYDESYYYVDSADSSPEMEDPYIYNLGDQFDDSVWNEIDHDIKFLEELENVETRDILKGSRSRSGCVEIRGPSYNTSSDEYPHTYYNISCQRSEGQKHYHHQLCSCYNKKCETKYKELPIFKKSFGTNCWKLDRTVSVQTGCVCGK